MRFPVKKATGQEGYSVIEGMMVVSILAIVIGGVVSLMQISYWMNRQSQDGYDAQNEGRRVLSQMVSWLRPAQPIPSAPYVHALSNGTVIDARIDTEKDSVPKLARLQLDRVNEKIVLYLDDKDSGGQYNYEAAGATYLDYYGEGSSLSPTEEGHWDEMRVIAEKIVNAPESGADWSDQTPATDPSKDFRLFTFYGDDFDLPLDTVGNPNWTNFVRGVKLYIWSDIQPAEIPSPFGIQTNVNLRNIRGE